MSEQGNSKPSVFSNAGLMTVIAAAISAMAAVGVAYIQKSGPAEKTPEASAAPSGAGAAAAPVYVTKVINGKTVRVLVPTAPAGKAASAGTAAKTAGEAQPAAQAGAAAHEYHAAAEPDHTPAAAADPEPDPPADTSGEDE
jgi:hypothetical protein